MTYEKIPKKYQVGGQRIDVRDVERCDDNTIGTCCLAGGFIAVSLSTLVPETL